MTLTASWVAHRFVLPWAVAVPLGLWSSAQALGATHEVTIDGMSYHPASLHVSHGDRIVWRNRDIVPHTATAEDRSFDSGRIDPGQQWTVIVSAAGHIVYACAYHPTMQGTLEVER